MTTRSDADAPGDRIVGRAPELDAVHAFLDAPAAGPGALLLAGEAGIGKTTVWEAAVEHARTGGALVLVTRPADTEAGLALSGLGDLLDPVGTDAVADLPVPLGQSVEVALLRRAAIPDEAADPRTLAVAVLHLLRALASKQRVVIAIDDVQWLDAGSASVLRYALRRLADAPVQVVAALRIEPGAADPLDLPTTVGGERVTRVTVGPLTVEEIGALVRIRLGVSLPRPELVEVHAVSGGNPFFALEIVRGADRREHRPDRTGRIQIPGSLREAVQRRLLTVSDAALEVLLVAAAVERPTLELLTTVFGAEERVRAGLVEAERGDIVRLEGRRIRFTHPLLASTVYTSAPVLSRHELHRRLGRLLPDVEERALHRALGSTAPDPGAAAELAEAAERAVRRGAPDAAARLLEHALRLTPDGDADRRRSLLLAAADASRRAGAARRSEELLREAITASPPGPERARALRLLAEATYNTDGPEAAIRRHMAVLEEPGADGATRAASHIDLAWYSLYGGDPDGARAHAQLGLTTAEGTGDEVLLMRALDAAAHVAFCHGLPERDAMMERALALERRHAAAVYPEDRPSATLAQHLLYRDELDQARQRFQALADDAVRAGDESGRCTPYYHLALVELAAGNWEVALRYAREAHEILHGAERTGEIGSKLWAVALVQAHLGRMDEARATAEAGLGPAERAGALHAVARLRGVLGFLHLSAGDLAAARVHLDAAAAAADRLAFGEPGFFRFVPDRVEALAGSGALGEAETLAVELIRAGTVHGRAWAVATGRRGLAIVEASRGRLPSAVHEASRSVEEAEVLGEPFEIARSLLVLGGALRRANRRREAREHLGRARELFDALGATAWSARTTAELGRIGGRTASGDQLTDTERQIAEHVARGLRNREIADRMFVSVRTVEANLSRIYSKLSLRSRTELARFLDPD